MAGSTHERLQPLSIRLHVVTRARIVKERYAHEDCVSG
jgi:hypothetical protein